MDNIVITLKYFHMGKSGSRGGSKSTTVTNARSAKTGRFVTKTYAKNHPSTTEIEQNKK